MSDDRLTELEIRYMVQQDLLQKLSEVLLQQGRDLERLRREVELLRGRINDGPAPMPADEKPPHY
jgi:SlyX protein